MRVADMSKRNSPSVPISDEDFCGSCWGRRLAAKSHQCPATARNLRTQLSGYLDDMASDVQEGLEMDMPHFLQCLGSYLQEHGWRYTAAKKPKTTTIEEGEEQDSASTTSSSSSSSRDGGTALLTLSQSADPESSSKDEEEEEEEDEGE